MTSSALKWIALAAMLIDHIGLLFFADIEMFRLIGRLAFPIFAFLISEGFTHTSSRTLYGLRLLFFALIAELPYDLCMYGSTFYRYSQNVLFELLIGFCALIFMEKAIRKSALYFSLVLVCIALSEFLFTAYGAFGICLIVLFYALRSFRGADILAFIGITYLFYGFTSWGFSFGDTYYKILAINSTQMYCLFATIPLVFYNGKHGKYGMKWLFYIIYPVHLIVLYFIDVYVNTSQFPKLW